MHALMRGRGGRVSTSLLGLFLGGFRRRRGWSEAVSMTMIISNPSLPRFFQTPRSLSTLKLNQYIMSRQVCKARKPTRSSLANIQKANIAAHYTRLLRRWPTDRLRPEERTFQRLLQNRIQHPAQDTTAAEKECNAAYLLLDNTFTKRFPLSDKIMKPASDPGYYARVEQEVHELPSRSWMGRMAKKLQGMVRFQ